MPKQPEGKLHRDMQQRIKEAGGRAFKIQASEESFQEVGIPDLLCCIAGRFVGIEVKQPGAKLRPAQRVVLHEIFDAGGVAAVVESHGQLQVLLSYLKRSEASAKAAGLCYDRGEFRTRCKFI